MTNVVVVLPPLIRVIYGEIILLSILLYCDTCVEMMKVQHMWRIYLQRQEVQQSQGDGGERNISGTSHLSFLH